MHALERTIPKIRRNHQTSTSQARKQFCNRQDLDIVVLIRDQEARVAAVVVGAVV